jgi:D-alanyl-D-alanine carboxypeptidase
MAVLVLLAPLLVSVSIKSPLPQALRLTVNQHLRTISLWSPSYASENTPPAVTARAILMYDLTTETVLFSKNESVRMPMASLTKIMTAVVSLTHIRPLERYVISSTSLVGENSMGLQAGEIFSRTELLYGLILPSGNDAAEALAYNYPGGRTAFLNAMHTVAESIGMTDTKFNNPSGLQEEGTDQYTTARDLLLLTRYALTIPEFRDIVATYRYDIASEPTHQSYTLINDTNLLTSYPGVKGVKTGYTPEAGLCLVTYLEYGDHQIIGIILGSRNRREEMRLLLDKSLLKLGITPPPYQ